MVCKIFVSLPQHEFLKLFVKLYTTIFLLILSTTVIMAPLTLTNAFGTFCGIQFIWNKHGNYGWMSDTLGEKFNFYYFADDMVTDGLFVDAAKDKIEDNIICKKIKGFLFI